MRGHLSTSSGNGGERKVFVSYFDVSKAFDTVWINGLFSKLHDIGLTGKLMASDVPDIH